MKPENYCFKKMCKWFSNLDIGWAVLNMTAKAEPIKAKTDRITA